MSSFEIPDSQLRAFADYSRDARTMEVSDTGPIEAVVAGLRSFGRLTVEVESPRTVQGTASYWDVFCYRPIDSAVKLRSQRTGEKLRVEGICLYLCELHPVAVWSGQVREGAFTRRTESGLGMGSGMQFLDPNGLGRSPGEGWAEVVSGLEEACSEHGFRVANSEEMSTPLPDEIDVDTLLPMFSGRADILLFDTLFFWSD